ncbi:exodeoxyribonuclease V subunit gamma [Klebsiella pneumoniae]|nr:exodeoxyribonuclease V subunit gamma [Klebsiella pneumoniae]
MNESGVRWGMDEATTSVSWTCRRPEQRTWRFGLTRMLLSYAMDESREGEWRSVLPYDRSSGLIAELVGNLTSLQMQLNLRGDAAWPSSGRWRSGCRSVAIC